MHPKHPFLIKISAPGLIRKRTTGRWRHKLYRFWPRQHIHITKEVLAYRPASVPFLRLRTAPDAMEHAHYQRSHFFGQGAG